MFADEARPSPAPSAIGARLKLLEVARAKQPVGLVTVPGDARRRLLVVEKGGRLRVIENGVLAPGSILDVSNRVSGGNEQGLLGAAVKSGKLYINYTDKNWDTRIVRISIERPHRRRFRP